MNRRILQALLVGAMLLPTSVGCQKKDSSRKETFPVTGQVFVDGKPAAELKVELHDEKGMDKANPTVSSGMTDADGKFSISTYENGDGVPAGNYTLTFIWGQINVLSMQYGGPDKLQDLYSDPAKSTHKVQVTDGKPTDLGKIELKTK